MCHRVTSIYFDIGSVNFAHSYLFTRPTRDIRALAQQDVCKTAGSVGRGRLRQQMPQQRKTHTHTNTGIWHSRHIRPSYMFLLISRNVLKQKNRHTFLVREENAYRHRPRVFDVNSVCSMIKCIEYNAWLHSTRVAQKLTMSNNVAISKLIA